jgi:hypothetical protein
VPGAFSAATLRGKEEKRRPKVVLAIIAITISPIPAKRVLL